MLYEKLVLRIAPYIGFTLMKKYWPVGGSFWNKNKMNRRKREDLNKVIDDAWEYTKMHIVSLITSIIFYISNYFADVVSSRKIVKLLIFQLIVEGYTFLLHEYNRILARRALNELNKNPHLEIKDNPRSLMIQNYHHLRLLEHEDYNYIALEFKQITPLFKSKDRKLWDNICKYYDQVGFDIFAEEVFLHENDFYSKFK